MSHTHIVKKVSDDIHLALSADDTLKLTVTDDGTYYAMSYSGTTLFKIRKSDKQLLLAAGVDTDETL